jgi:hypothetical protein
MTSSSPRRRYEATGRREEYDSLVEHFKVERSKFLTDFPSLTREIVDAAS